MSEAYISAEGVGGAQYAKFSLDHMKNIIRAFYLPDPDNKNIRYILAASHGEFEDSNVIVTGFTTIFKYGGRDVDIVAIGPDSQSH